MKQIGCSSSVICTLTSSRRESVQFKVCCQRSGEKCKEVWEIGEGGKDETEKGMNCYRQCCCYGNLFCTYNPGWDIICESYFVT